MIDERAKATVPRGEREWGEWLNKLSRSKKEQVVDKLVREFATTVAAGGQLSAVRMMEAAVAPASPPFSKLDVGEAHRLQSKLKAKWGPAGKTKNGMVAVTERFQALLGILENWKAYKETRKQDTDASVATKKDKATEAELDEYYAEWVLKPFRANLQQVLADRKESRRELSFRLNISEAYFSLILSGDRVPSLKKMADISLALGIPLGNLLTLSKYDLDSDAGRRHFAMAQPGDRKGFIPGQISTPFDALEKHFQVVFYPGPDLPAEKIPARSQLILEPNVGIFSEREKYAVRDKSGLVVVCSYVSHFEGGESTRFMSFDGSTITVSAEDDAQRKAVSKDNTGPVLLGRIVGALLDDA